MRTLYVLVFIEIGSRRLRFSLATTNPDGIFATQQARNLYMDEDPPSARLLIRDRDSKFSLAFDGVFDAEGVRVIKTPIRAPNAPLSCLLPEASLKDVISETRRATAERGG